jgi:hypothetical protein
MDPDTIGALEVMIGIADLGGIEEIGILDIEGIGGFFHGLIIGGFQAGAWGRVTVISVILLFTFSPNRP